MIEDGGLEVRGSCVFICTQTAIALNASANEMLSLMPHVMGEGAWHFEEGAIVYATSLRHVALADGGCASASARAKDEYCDAEGRLSAIHLWFGNAT